MPSRWRWSTLTGSTLILHFLLLVAGCSVGDSIDSKSTNLLDFQRCSCDSATYCLTDADVIKVNMIYSVLMERMEYAPKEEKERKTYSYHRN